MKTVFISIDNIGMLVEDTNMIRERVANRLHVPFERITVVYTHILVQKLLVSNL